MKRMLKSTLAVLLTVVMVLGAAPLAGFVGLEPPENQLKLSPKASALETSAKDSLIYGTNGSITRAEWLHNLAVVFEMSVENEEYPDNYFSDLESTNEYYYDVLLNVQFGVVDVEAGGEVKPDEIATREFATHTLNFCLGYQLEETEYTFSDSDDCIYPADAQIAVNRSWVALIDGKFMPSQAVTSSEVTAMLNDAAAVLGTTVAEENYDSEYIINSSYVEIPDGTEVTVDSETSTITIVNSPETISAGDGFVIYQNSIANAFIAESVSVNENITTITYSDVTEEDAYEYVDAQGIVDADFNTIEAYDDTEIVYVDDETGDEYETYGDVVEVQSVRGVKEFNKTFKANRELDFGTGIKASVSVTMKNPKVVYGIKTFEGEAFAYLEGDVSVSYSIKYDAIADLSKACGLDDIRLVNLTVPGVGGLVISVDISAEGSLSGINAGTLKTGVQFADKTLRLIKDFKSKDFTLSLEIKATLGLQAKFGLTDLPVLKGYVYAKIGMTGGMKFSVYSGNVTPKECRHFSAHLYASAGATVSVSILIYKESYDISHTIFDEDNSPIKIAHHYEDGKKVYKCTHGTGTTEGDNGYRTPSSSKYNDAGWYGKSSSTGYDSNGNPVTIYTYTLDEDNNATITSYTGNATALNIPEKIDGYTVVGIGAKVFSGNSQLRTVNMSDTITRVDKEVFYCCENLVSVHMSDSLEFLGRNAFYGCVNLISVNIPASLKEIDIYGGNYWGPFEGCVNLKDVKIDNGATVIPQCLFEGCIGLKSIDIPDSVVSIERRAFAGCTGLKEVDLPTGLEKIDYHAFMDCLSLTTVYVYKNIKTVETYGWNYWYPFYGCENLKTIVFEQEMTALPGRLFGGCSGLETVDIPNSVTAIGDRCFADCVSLKTIDLPDGLVSMGERVFFNCTSLKSAIIPKTITTIDTYGGNYWYPFEGCSSLNEIIFDTGITKIPNSILGKCPGLTKMVIPDTVTEIGANAFDSCTNLIELELPDTILKIGDRAFFGCTQLKKVELPEFLISIGFSSFENCIGLEELYVPKTIKEVKTYGSNYWAPFSYCCNLSKITFATGIEKIPDYLFARCDGIVEIEIPETVLEIGNRAFFKCINLTEAVLPSDIEAIYDYAFEETNLNVVSIPQSVSSMYEGIYKNCKNLVSVHIPEGRININVSTFEGCILLKEIILPSTVERICESAFKNCTSLEEIVWSKKLSRIDSYAFENCDSLSTVNIPTTVTLMGEGIFYDCDSLTEITIPNSVTEIGVKLFYDCDLLTKVSFGNGITKIPVQSFEHCDILSEVVVPKGVKTIGANAFRDCVSLKKITIPVTVTSIDSTSLSYPDRTVIYGCVGSYAETYANEYGFEFVDITKHITGLILKDNDEEKIIIDKGYYVTPEFEYLPEDTTDVIILTSNDTSIVTVDGDRLYGKKNGSATVTATTTGGLEYTFGVYVHTLNSISVSSQPIKTSYKHGEELDLTGLGITASYGDGTSNTVTDYTVSGYDSTVYGAQTVTVTYNGKKTTFIVEVIDDRTKLTSIAITTLPSKIAYNKGESFDPTGMVVTGYYSDGTSAPVTGYTVSAMNSLKTGTQTLTVTYEEFTATFTVTVGMATVTLSSVSIKTLPNKVVYIIGESFDASGLVLVANYSDGSTKEVSSGYSVGGFSSSSVGTKTITVTYEGKSTTFNVTVKENEPVVKDVYTITFNSNGGSAVNPITAEEGSQISAPTNPTKTGYTFAGWTDVNGKSVSVPSTMPSYNTTLYAKWAVNSYTVTWIVDDETTEENYKFGATISEPSEPVKEGYKFIGWTPVVPDIMPEYNLTFTAVFEKIVEPDEPVVTTYTVKWIVDGNTTTQTYKEGDRIVKPANPSKSGYTFKGWTPDVPSTMPAYDLTFTAVFEKNADPVVPSEPPKADVINQPTQTTVSYGDAIILHVDASKIPAGGRVEWTANNSNFNYSANGDTCRIDPNKSGSTTFTATIYDAQGNAVLKDEQTMTSKAGFFDKIIAFFKKLFGLTKVIPQAFKGVF